MGLRLTAKRRGANDKDQKYHHDVDHRNDRDSGHRAAARSQIQIHRVIRLGVTRALNFEVRKEGLDGLLQNILQPNGHTIQPPNQIGMG